MNRILLEKTLKTILISVILLLVACTVKDGEITGFQPSFGGVHVLSTGASDARIFLDYKDTGLTTPALINNVRVGRHVIHIFLSNHRPDADSILVDVEEGRETSVSFELTNVPNVGNLKVFSNPDSALVLLDKLEFGYTPFEVKGLLVGDYGLRIVKSGYEPIEKSAQITQNQTVEISENLILKPRLVLFEHYSNTYCIPCVDVDVIIEDVVHQLGPQTVISLGYHPNIPGPADPFYLAAKPENDARRSYYSVPYSPYAIIDGIKIINTTSLSQLEQNILGAVDERRQILPNAILEFFDFKTVADTISGRVKVTALDNLGTDVHLRIALIERTIDTAQPQGSNGQKHFFDVLRDFKPNAEGVSLMLSANQKQSVKFEFIRDAEWGDDLDVIAFMQADDTKEVIQTIWTAE